jgi:recombinational DNA repair protein RecR
MQPPTNISRSKSQSGNSREVLTMTNFNSQSSATYQVIANLLRHIESLGFPKSDWGICDAGQTLEANDRTPQQDL